MVDLQTMGKLRIFETVLFSKDLQALEAVCCDWDCAVSPGYHVGSRSVQSTVGSCCGLFSNGNKKQNSTRHFESS